MNNKFLFFLFFFFASLNLVAQTDVPGILQKSLKASSQITNGSYQASLKMKYLVKNDTLVLNGICRFHRYPPDTLKGAKFELAANDIRVLYDGRKKITIYTKDSLAIVHDKWKYPLKFAGSVYHLLCDLIVTGRGDFDVTINNPEIKKQLLKDTLIDKVSCWHILFHPPDDETSQNISRHLYISKENYLLMGEVLSLDAHQHHQFTELFLQNVKINSKGLNENYGTELIPKDFFIKNYVPDKLNKLHAPGITAPPFTLTSLEGKTFSLHNLKGNIIIMYFWNANDQQSRVRLQPLQKIYEKYSEQGIEVLGMNVSDNNKEHLKKLLQNKKITFPQLTDAANTGEKYNLLNLPTIYVIGKNGKIIEGFVPPPKENLELKLEKIIQKNQ